MKYLINKIKLFFFSIKIIRLMYKVIKYHDNLTEAVEEGYNNMSLINSSFVKALSKCDNIFDYIDSRGHKFVRDNYAMILSTRIVASNDALKNLNEYKKFIDAVDIRGDYDEFANAMNASEVIMLYKRMHIDSLPEISEKISTIEKMINNDIANSIHEVNFDFMMHMTECFVAVGMMQVRPSIKNISQSDEVFQDVQVDNKNMFNLFREIINFYYDFYSIMKRYDNINLLAYFNYDKKSLDEYYELCKVIDPPTL